MRPNDGSFYFRDNWFRPLDPNETINKGMFEIEHSTEEQRLVTKDFGKTQAFNQLTSRLKRGKFKVVANLRIWNFCNIGKVNCADKCACIYFIFILYLIARMKGSMSSS